MNIKTLSDLSFYQLWAGVSLFILIRFIVVAFGTYLIFYVAKIPFFKKIKIQQSYPTKKMLGYEIKHSFSNLLLLGFLSSIILLQFRYGFNQLYENFSDIGVLYYIGSIIVMMILHDTWFYWVHRLMHHPILYKTFHETHHKSINPSPFSSFSMDWTEMLVEFGIFPIIVLIIPMHITAFSIFVFIAFMFNIIGHLGFEIIPKKVLATKIGSLINSGTKHNIHHSKFNYNYSYYFTFWDKIMHTEYKSK